MKDAYEVTVIVVTYNSPYYKLVETLDSIIKQRKVNLQIVIADDGSRNWNFERIERFFAERGYDDYVIVRNRVNRGTVYNYYSGLRVSRGLYAKGISPGDMLVGKDTLRNWIDFLEASGSEWSFSDIINYRYVDGHKKVISDRTYPDVLRPYYIEDNKLCRWNYLVLDDLALGAAMIGKTELQLKYIKRIVGKVKYAEDNIWRLMMYDGYVGKYFPKPVVLYENNTGISTVPSKKWRKRLMTDCENTYDIIFSEEESADEFQKKMIRAIKRKKKNVYLAVFTRGQFLMWIKKTFLYRKSKMVILDSNK